jgi:hypothetical protein
VELARSQQKNSPVRMKTPVELSGTKKQGRKGNKSQAIVLLLLEKLPRKGYHIFLDTLFVSKRILESFRNRGFGATGTCRTNSGVYQDLIDMKKRNKKNVIPWGTTEAILTKSKKIIQVGFKNITFVLGISIVLDMNMLVLRNRKKPSTTSTSAKTTRTPFAEDKYTKDLWIL